MSSVDPYRVTDKLDDAVLNAIATRLELRGKHPSFVRMMQDYLGAMNIDSAKTVLDIGCGTGVAARAIASRHGFEGRVVGVDRSPYFIAVAKKLSRDEGLVGRIDFHVGDTHSLALKDEAFDAVVAHTLVSHVDDPLMVVREARRVVRSGGTIGIFDGDYASLTFGQDDAEKGRANDEMLISAVVTNPRVMRQMPRLLRQAGLELVTCFPYVLAEIGRADFWAPAIESFRKLLPAAGAKTAAEAAAWADGMLRASAEGVFFGASNYYGYVVRRP